MSANSNAPENSKLIKLGAPLPGGLGAQLENTIAAFGFETTGAFFRFTPAREDSWTVLYSWGDLSKQWEWKSVSKLVSARVLLGAVENGVLSLEEDLSALLPPTPLGAPITLADLLAHRSGLAMRVDEYKNGPRVKRQYSNRGYEVAAQILAARSSVSWRGWVEAMIFNPLGLATREPGSPASDLFGSLNELLVFARECALPRFLSPRSHALFSVSDGAGLAGTTPGYGYYRDCTWALGAEVKGPKGERGEHWMAPSSSPATFGHFGRSGSFLWVDPVQGCGAVFLGAQYFGDVHKRLWSTLNELLVRI